MFIYIHPYSFIFIYILPYSFVKRLVHVPFIHIHLFAHLVYSFIFIYVYSYSFICLFFVNANSTPKCLGVHE